MTGINGQQQRVENQRKRQIDHGEIAPCGIANVPLYAGVVLIPVALPGDGAADNAAAAAEQARQATAAQQAQQQQAFVTQPQQGSYRNCSEARAAGAAPLYRGQPGYSARLDRDGDGIACE